MTQFDVQLKLELLLYVLYEQYKSSYIKQQPPSQKEPDEVAQHEAQYYLSTDGQTFYLPVPGRDNKLTSPHFTRICAL